MATSDESPWKKWHEERQRFAELNSEGFKGDLKNLRDHINALREVAPRDSVGYPHHISREYIGKLHQNLEKALDFFEKAEVP